MRPLDLRWALLALSVVLVVAAPAPAQDAEADQAKALLHKGVTQYARLEFKPCQSTLLKVDRDKLSRNQRKQLDQYLGKVNEAIKGQASAMQAYTEAEKALQANDLATAKALFEVAAKSDFVPAAVRRDARARVALVKKKIEASGVNVVNVAIPPKVTVTEPKVTVTEPKVTVTEPKVTVTEPKVTVTEPKVTVTEPKSTGIDDVRMQQLQARVDRAKDAVDKGNAALDNDQIARAISHFEQAVKIAPEYEPAVVRLEYARSLVGQAGGLSAITRLERKNRIRRQRNDVRYAEAMKRSYEAMQAPRRAEDFARAKDQVSYAKTLIETSKAIYSDSEYRKLKIEMDDRLVYINMAQAKWNKQEVRRQYDEIKRRELERETETARRKAEKLRMLKTRVETLRSNQKYGQAIEVLEEVLGLAPDDEWAAEWHDQLISFQLLLEDKQAHVIGRREEARQGVGIREAQIPWYELLRYPRDWPARTLVRQASGAAEAAESEANRTTRKRMRVVLPKLEFSGIRFEDVVQFLRDVGNVNIYVKWPALQTSAIDRAASVNVKLRNVSFEKALKTILDDVGGSTTELRYVLDEGVITISTREDLAQRTVTRVYDIRDLIVRVPNFQGPRISLDSTTDNGGDDGGFGGGGGSTQLFACVGTNGGNASTQETEMTRAELVANILDLIRTTIDRESWVQGGGTVGSVKELGGQIIVTQTSENHRSMLELLGKLREARAIQINVEARFIQVTTGFLNHIGIDLDFFFNLGSDIVRTSDGLTPEGWLADPLTGANVISGGPRLVQWGGKPFLTNSMTPVTVSQSGGMFTTPGATPITGGTSIGSAVTGSALTIGGSFLDAIQVDFLINATQAHAGTRTLTAPRLTLFNGQRAYVSIGNEEAYVSNVQFVPGTGANAAGNFNRQVSRVTTGTVLDVEATVSADRRYVTLTMRPQVSRVNSFVEYNAPATSPIDPGTGLPVAGSGLIQLPNITRQVLECTVSVPDGGTLLLGGQRLAGENEREMGIPVISKIPILNRAFTNKSLVRDESTLLILVKPEIIIQQEYEERAFPTR